MRSLSIHAAAAGLAVVLIGAVATINWPTATAVALASVTLALAGARRTAITAAIVLAAFALVGVRVDSAHRSVASATGHTR
jgi:hypothetical protein